MDAEALFQKFDTEGTELLSRGVLTELLRYIGLDAVLGDAFRCAGKLPSVRQEKRAQRLTFRVRRPPGGVGVFHAKGWWPKSSCPPSKSLSSLGFEERNLGCPGNFAGMSRTPGGVQKVCAKKVCAQFSCPTQGRQMNNEMHACKTR